jgi:hypothetical protein
MILLAVAAASPGSMSRSRTKKLAKTANTKMARYPYPAILAAWRGETSA